MTTTDEVQARVTDWLTEHFEKIRTSPDGHAIVQRGDITAGIRVGALAEDGPTIVQLHVPILLDAPFTSELKQFVGEHSDDFHFGHYVLSADDTRDTCVLVLAHTLLADQIVERELLIPLLMMMQIAEAHGEELRQRFGGRRPSQ